LVALVQRLAVASSEATRLATEVQGGHSCFTSIALADEICILAQLPHTLSRHAASSITWVRGVPKTPAHQEAAFPDGSGETWYVVIRGREPGLYRTA
jgi:hypothetical protein